MIRIFGRSSSHFTRVATIFAHELGVPFELAVVRDLASIDPVAYGGHPALKVPSLHLGGQAVFGAENICRALAVHADRGGDARVVLPEHVEGIVARNAQELTWHSMAAQVQLIGGTIFGKLPADNVFFARVRTSLEGALAWLDANLDRALGELPRPRDVSVLEVTLFCLTTHFDFRRTIAIEPYRNLRLLATELAKRPSAQRTQYRHDA